MAAFTLAEVLITLGVIGVVAAMTLPTLIKNYQVKQTESVLKATYSILSNGFKNIMTHQECTDLVCTGIFVPVEAGATSNLNTSNPEFNEKMAKAAKETFNTLNIYKYGEFPKAYEVSYLKSATNKTVTYDSSNFVIELTNGVFVFVQNWGCFEVDNKTSKLNNVCGWLTVDINGYKKPNKYGHDVFGLGRLYSNGMIIPNTSYEYAVANVGKDNALSYGTYWKNRPTLCGKEGVKLKDDDTSEIRGQDCFARVRENNWELDYLK